MTQDEWESSRDPKTMIWWLKELSYVDELWDFTIECCRSIEPELRSGPFRRIAEHILCIGKQGVDYWLGEVTADIERLERRFHKSNDPVEQERLNRQLGFARMLFVFQHQDAPSAAVEISDDLLNWAEDIDVERQQQADLLREFVPFPVSQIADEEE